MVREVPICFFCQYKLPIKGNKCQAFPENIPDEILIGPNNHYKPYFNDNGIRFKLDPEKRKLYEQWKVFQKDYQKKI